MKKLLIDRRRLSKSLTYMPLFALVLQACRKKSGGGNLQGSLAAQSSSKPAFLIDSTDPTFENRCKVYNRSFDNLRPKFVAVCKTEQDIAAALAYARTTGLRVGIRGGGHSYMGQSLSDGLVLDLSAIASISVDAAQQTATIGAGCRQIDVAHALAEAGLALPFGVCPQVGVSGFVLGGGQGPLKRAWSVMSDRLVEARLIDAHGVMHTCSEKEKPELFWALRGGGHASFGVVTSLTLKAERIAEVTYYELAWNWTEAAAVFAAWVSWSKSLPNSFGSRFELDLAANGYKQIRVSGNALDDQAKVDALLAQLPPPRSKNIVREPFFTNILRWEGCDSFQKCHIEANMITPVEQNTFAAKSRFVRKEITADTIKNTLEAFATHPSDPDFVGGVMIVDAEGGAIDVMPAEASAYMHRGCSAMIQYLSYWKGASLEPQCRDWLRHLYNAWTPGEVEEAYQNYTDPDLVDTWKQAYYGANLTRLEQIKKVYDPEGFFIGRHIL